MTGAVSKIYPLTSVRFLAAMYVVLEHGRSVVPMLSSGNVFVQQFVSLGYVSVNFFFVLSGYILAVVYLQDKSGINPQKFWTARSARIYPIYIVALLLDLPHYLHIWQVRHALGVVQPGIPRTLLANVILLQAWWTQFLGINDPGWSLSTEAFFYALFPIAGLLLWRLSRRWTLIAGFGLYAAGMAVALCNGWLHMEGSSWRYNPATHLHEFLLGILTARLHFLWLAQGKPSLWLKRWAPALLIGSALVYLCLIPASGSIPFVLLTHGVFCPLFCVILLALASGNRWIQKIFSRAWLVLLGEASYALYLIHVPIFFMLRAELERHGAWLFLVYVSLCIALSVLSYLYVERPSRRWILQRMGGNCDTAHTTEVREAELQAA